MESVDAAANASTSYSLGIGQTSQGTISSLGDHDWYRVSLIAGQTYAFADVGTGTSSLRDTYLYLRDSSGTLLAFDDDSGPGISSSLTFTATTTGTYYIDAGAWDESSTGQYGITATLGNRPNFDIPMGAGAIDAYSSWSAPGIGATVTYGFRQSPATYSVSGSNTSTFTQVSAAEMAAVQSILQLYSDICGVTFLQVNAGGYTNNATILIGNYSDPSDGAGAFAFYPGSTASTNPAGDLWLNLRGGIATSSIPLGSYTFFAIIHELGHALGLSHPGDYNAAPGVAITYANNAQFIQDSEQYTIMSYFGGAFTGERPGNFATAQMPMMFDIYELQNIYGANNSTRIDNTVYGFGSNAGSIYDFSVNGAPQFCIWDAGGTDTLNCSGYSWSQVINLNAGFFSDVGGQTANISIALGVAIENATGGSGSDRIIGNELANRLDGGNGDDLLSGGGSDDILIGGAGSDTIDGGAGSDRAAFSGLWSSYTITDLGGGGIRVAGPDGIDTLTSVERLVFDDQTVNWSPNQTPTAVVLSNATGSIAENTSTANRIKVADVTVTGEGLGSNTIGLSGPDAAAFEIVGNALYLKVGTVLDFESKASYAVVVTVGTPTVTVCSTTYTLAISDMNDNAPVITTAASRTVAENSTVVAALTSTDADTVGTNPATFSITGGANAALFNIVGGNLVFRTAPNYETDPRSYQVQFSAFDGVNTTARMITVNLTDVNDNAPAITTAASQTIAANSTLVAALTSTDADTVGTNPATFSITGGADAALFNVVGGNLVFRSAPNYATDPHSYQVQVSAFDGANTSVALITVSVTNGPGAPNVPGVTVNGTARNDTINATTTVAGQPLPTNGDDTINGGSGNDIISALGGNDTLNGGIGADRMFGGTGNDTYVVDNSGDIVNETSGDGLDTVESLITFSLSDAVHAIGAIENLTLTGTAAINGTGNALANVITGNNANNILAGLGGADILDGSVGTDAASYASSSAGVNVSLMTGVGSEGDAQGDMLFNFENLTGSAFNDTLEGSSGNNVLVGGAGMDTVSYEHAAAGVTVSLAVSAAQNTIGAGIDTLSGFENLTGSAFNDTLTGTSGANTIIGGAGGDTIKGGGEADILTGGQGADRFVFTALTDSAQNTRDLITDFAHASDIIDFSAIDANTSTGGNQAFLFGGQNATVVGHSVTWFEDLINGNTIVQADVNGNTTADLQIVLHGTNLNLYATDFLL